MYEPRQSVGAKNAVFEKPYKLFVLAGNCIREYSELLFFERKPKARIRAMSAKFRDHIFRFVFFFFLVNGLTTNKPNPSEDVLG